jgi:hypothetical protein
VKILISREDIRLLLRLIGGRAFVMICGLVLWASMRRCGA